MTASSRSPQRHRRKSNIAQKQLPGGRRGACCICGIASMAQGTQVCHCEAPTGPWQSHAGSCDFADGFPVVRPCSARLPRRFAPRNDTSGAFTIITIGCSDRQHCAGADCPLPYNGVCGRRQCAQICCCQRRSLTAATDAIGFYVFNGSLYELQVPSRDCHGSCGASQ